MAANKQSSYDPVRTWWKFRMRPYEDDEEEDWWFASTGIPLIAATTGPLANVTSIAALVTSWRVSLDAGDGTLLPELSGVAIKDPAWVYWPNVASLICGFLGNIFLMFNFTHRVRYIIALPLTILLWYLSSAILIAITASNEIYLPPQRPTETYSQGFWYAVISAVLYTISSMLLMVNMLGYFLGHYPQQFTLTDNQRNLILQTILFHAWLAGGGAMFSGVENAYGQKGWSFVEGLYFCDVTILTVGFGDLYPTDDVGRGLVFPFSVGGIIMLGLTVSSIHNFASELGQDNIVRRHVEKQRIRTVDRAVSTSVELRRAIDDGKRPTSEALKELEPGRLRRPTTFGRTLRRTTTLLSIAAGPISVRVRKPKVMLLREEKDRFVAMRNIQHSTSRYKRWYALTLSVIAFSLLWCVGAVVFWVTEKNTLQLNYFQALYFGYVSLLTIGYGDLAPKSNAGRAFFVVWSLVAVPTMTILIGDMGDTIISNFKKGYFIFADFTLLPKAGIWHDFLQKHPWLLGKIEHRWGRQKKKEDPEAATGEQVIPVTAADETPEDAEAAKEDEEAMQAPPLTLDQLAREMTGGEEELSEHDLARKLALMIRKTAHDLRREPHKQYSFEEWVEITRLIRFTSSKWRKAGSDGTGDGDGNDEGKNRRKSSASVGLNQALFEPTDAERRESMARSRNSADADRDSNSNPDRRADGDVQRDQEEDNDEEEEEEEEEDDEYEDEGLIEWDWIGPNSPMMRPQSEPEFVLDRLCESMGRYIRRQVAAMSRRASVEVSRARRRRGRRGDG